MTGDAVLTLHGLSAHYGRREVFRDVSLDVGSGQALGVVGHNAAGKTTLLRTLVGLINPTAGDVRLWGLRPRDAMRRSPVAYFGGEVTLPGDVRAKDWGRLSGEAVNEDRRYIRTLSRGARQLLGLRTALSRPGLRFVVLDEPWEGLDPDGARWLSAVIEVKRDRGAAVVLSSHRLHDLAGVCDAYLFLMNQRSTVLRAQEISKVGPVTGALLTDVFDRLRGGGECDSGVLQS